MIDDMANAPTNDMAILSPSWLSKTLNDYDSLAVEAQRLRDAVLADAMRLRDEVANRDATIAVLKAENERLRKLFADAGHGEHNVLALVEHYQAESMAADEKIREVRRVLEDHGCECGCDGDCVGYHEDDKCLACRVHAALEAE